MRGSVGSRVSVLRAALVFLLLSLLAGAAWLLREAGPRGLPLPGCAFHQLTGLDCPGCGMTRAAHAALNGEFAAAFRFNSVGIILLPLALLGLSFEAAAWIRRDPAGPRFRVGIRGAKTIVWVVIVFWVVRNTPWWPWPID